MQRVFIGIPIDEQSQQQINEILEPIKKSRRDIRWVPVNNRHLTLAFMGNQAGSKVKSLLGLFNETYQQQTHFDFKLSLLTRFPEPAGRIIALVDDSSEALDRLFQITLTFLQRNNVELNLKEFRPHITLGRLKKAKQVKSNFDQQTDINLNICNISFYQSTLSKSGSIYSVLKEIALKS